MKRFFRYINKYNFITSLTIIITFTACGIQQNLSVSNKLNEGMTKSEVEEIMGAPVKSDFFKNIEEWHYCKTGMSVDEFIAVFFYEGKLIAKKNYSVTSADVNGAFGSCEKFIKLGNYKEPDIVAEIRIR